MCDIHLSCPFSLIYSFTLVLGLCPFERPFSRCREQGPLLVSVPGLLISMVSLVAGHRLCVPRAFSSCGSWALRHRLSSYGTQAQLPCIMWDLPGPWIEPMSPALAGTFFPSFFELFIHFWLCLFFVAVARFLWLQEVGAALHCGACAPHCSGLWSRAQALGSRASTVAARGVSSHGAGA